jgi:hypothetical protein
MGRSRQRTGNSDAGDEPSALAQGRLAHARRAWADAYTWLTRADALEPLGDEDLEKLAWAAALSGQDDESLRLLERLYHARVDSGPPRRSGLRAYWMALGKLMTNVCT